MLLGVGQGGEGWGAGRWDCGGWEDGGGADGGCGQTCQEPVIACRLVDKGEVLFDPLL